MKVLLSILFFFFLITNAFSTTWDEPWQKDIIEESDYLVLATVIESSDSVIAISIEKSFGKKLSGTITIDDFFLLDICSFGGHGPRFHHPVNLKGYFFLKEDENGNYQLPTPTSGFAKLEGGKVYATFRHSYHQTMVSKEIYEMAYKVIWNKYHELEYDETRIEEFIRKYTQKDPAGFEENEIDTFFCQHVALESAYLLGIELPLEILVKFVEFENFHSNISSLLAFRYNKSEEAKNFLLNYISKTADNNFTVSIAIYSLWNLNDKKYQKKLWKIRKNLSEESSGFGGDIMDPRVCTRIASPKDALLKLKKQ